jgi:hypothetical protein
MNKFQIYEDLLNLPSVQIVDVTLESKAITIDCQVTKPTADCPNGGKPSTRSVKRMAFGMTNLEHLKLRVLVNFI